MQTTITGYQWGDRNQFIGTYTFDNNQDKDDIHLPPKTTLIAPPPVVADGYELVWNVSEWLLRVKQPDPVDPPANVQPTKIHELETFVGYQWGKYNLFIGPYEFYGNAENPEINLPPHTTMIAPPIGLKEGKIPAWDDVAKVWTVIDDPNLSDPLADLPQFDPPVADPTAVVDPKGK
jgi:hypothetical protein